MPRFIVEENGEHPCCWDAQITDTENQDSDWYGRVVECQRNTAIIFCEILNSLHEQGELPDVVPRRTD